MDGSVPEPPAAATRDVEQGVQPAEAFDGCRHGRVGGVRVLEVRREPGGLRAARVSRSTSVRQWVSVRDTTNTRAPSAANSSADASAMPVLPVMSAVRPAIRPPRHQAPGTYSSSRGALTLPRLSFSMSRMEAARWDIA